MGSGPSSWLSLKLPSRLLRDSGSRAKEALARQGQRQRLFYPAAQIGNPDKFLRDDSAGRIRISDNLNLPGVKVNPVGEVAKDDLEAGRSLLDGGFREARDLEKAAGEGGIAGGVEGGGGLGLVGGDGGTGIEIGGGADGDFDVMKSALGLDDAVPAEGGTGFGESGDSARKFAAVSAGLESGDGVAVEDNAHTEVES